MATLFDENRFEAEIDSKVKTIVKNELPKESVHRATVLRRDSSGTWWVRLDSGDETPVLVNKVDMSVGDVVTVTLRDHVTYADGNITSPPMSAYNAANYVDDVVAKNVKAVTADIGYLKADVATIGYAQIEDADITNARIQNLVYEVTQNITHLNAVDANILYLQTNSLTANSAIITDLQAETAKIENLEAEDLSAAVGYIGELTAGSIDAEDIISDHADIGLLEADNATIKGRLDAAEGNITNLTAENVTIDGRLDAAEGNITSLTAENATIDGRLDAAEAVIDDLDSNYAHITYLDANTAVIDNAKIGYADVNGLNANYAQINLANVNNTWIENGVVKRAAISDAQIAGVSANKLTAGTIDASNINVHNLRADNLIVTKLNGQPVFGGYEAVNSNASGYSSKNPQAQGWYEISNGQMVATTDTVVDSTKAYYTTSASVQLYDQNYIDGMERQLNQRIDGAIETFSGADVPTLLNYPYTNWYDTTTSPVTDNRAEHVGDLYYVVDSNADEDGYCYRFYYDNTTQDYMWVLIKDSDVTAALSDISDLQTFQSETSTWITETDRGIETIRSEHTELSGVVDKTVKKSIQLWKTINGTTAPNPPYSDDTTSHVTSTSTAGNTWTTVVPAYDTRYPNYYYCWQYELADGKYRFSAVVRDMAMEESQATARSKAKNFTSQPTPPYSVGDTWTQGSSGDMKVCTTARASGSYTASDWVLASKYTDDTVANANIKSSVMLWYTSNSTTPPGKPYNDGSTSYVTNDSTSSGAWTTVVPVYASGTPYYHYCYQQQRGDGKYQWTAPVYDEATSTAMQKAQAALPQSTFNTFQQTTFKDVVDAVDEQSTTITQLTETAQYGGVNLLRGTADMLTVNGVTVWNKTLSSMTIEDGVVTVPGDGNWRSISNASGIKLSDIAGKKLTFSFDARAQASGASFRPVLELGGNSNEWATARESKYWTGNGSNDDNPVPGTEWSRHVISSIGPVTAEMFSNQDSGSSQAAPDMANDYLRLALHNHGNVTYEYRKLKLEVGSIATPWEYSQGDMTTISNTVNSVKSTATTNSSTISQLTTTLGTNADGTTKSGDVVHRMSSAEQTLDGFSNTVSAIAESSTFGDNVLTGNALNPYNWTVSAPDGASFTKTAYGTAGVQVTFNTVSGYELLYSPAITVTSGKAYTLVAEYTVGKEYTIASGKGGYGLSVYKAQPTSTYDSSNANFVARANFITSATRTAAKATVTFTAPSSTVYLGLNGGQIADSQTGLTFTLDKLSLVENLSSRVSQAETNISQTANAIGLTASGSATIANPNLSPFFENTPYRTTTGYDGSYWKPTSDNWLMDGVTPLSEGWAHVSVGASKKIEIAVPRIETIDSSKTYTLLFEWRNVTVTGSPNLYTRNYPASCQFTSNSYNCSWNTSSPSSGAKYVNMSVDTTAKTGSWQAAILLGMTNGSSISFDGDLRLSLYEGEYTGPWKPYAGSQLYASQAELSVQADRIGLMVQNQDGTGSLSLTSTALTAIADNIVLKGTTQFENGSTLAGYVGGVVDDIEVGGRNLLLGSELMENWGKGSSVTISDGVATLSGSSTSWNARLDGRKMDASMLDGVTQYTLSIDYKSSASCVVALTICGSAEPLSNNTYVRTKYKDLPNVTLPSTGGVWKRVTLWSRTIDEALLTAGSGSVVTWYPSLYARSDTTLYMRHWQLEIGNKPTDWMPAPEDMASASDSVEYINGTQTASTGNWTGVTKDSALYAGKTIAYRLPYAGNGNASLQLKDSSGNNVGENVAVYSMTTRVTTHYPAGSIIQMTYDGTNWRTAGWYNTNNYDRTLHNNYVKAASNVTSGALVCGTASGYRQIAASATFDIAYPILWASGAWTSGTQYANAYEAYPSVNPATTATVEGIGVNKTVFLKGSISGNTFTCAASNFLTCVSATTEDGYFYIPLGIVANDATTKMYFSTSKDVYAYVDGLFRQVTPTDIVATQKVYYRSKVSGTVPAPSTWITKTTDQYNATVSAGDTGWSTKVTPISSDKTNDSADAKYLYLYTVTQRKRLDGTVKNSSTNALLDDSTTVIDGGSIITNSITANQINTLAIDIGSFGGSIGGTNLLGRTDNPYSPTIAQSNAAMTFGSIGLYNSPATEVSIENYDNSANALVVTSTVTGNRGVGWYTKPGEVVAGKDYTFSCRVKTSVAATVHVHTAWRNGSATAAYAGWTAGGNMTTTADTWVDYSYTFKPDPNAQLTWEFLIGFCFSGATTGITMRVAHAKLEKGSVATDWQPSPDDLESFFDGYTILWNYENFSTANNGEGYICALNPKTGVRSDADGWTMWNGIKRTIPKGMVNPNAVHAYNRPTYVVCRLSSATATTGTNYIVSYNSGWKGGTINAGALSDWTWNNDTDIILGKYVEPSSEGAFVECEVYNPPWTSKQVTTSTTTSASAQSTANSANSKTDYYNRSCHVGNSSNTQTNLWRKFASYTCAAANYDPFIVFDVFPSGDMGDYNRAGRLEAHVRTAGTVGTVTASQCTLKWLWRGDGFALSDFVMVYKATSGTNVVIELWCRCPTSWIGYRFYQVFEGDRNGNPRTSALWTLYNSFTADGEASYSTDGYVKVESTDTSTAYITRTDNTGIEIHPATSLTDKLHIDANGTKIYKGGNLKANYADTISLYGGSSESGANPRTDISSSHLYMYDAGGTQRVSVNSGTGVILGHPSRGRAQLTDAGMTVYDNNNKIRTVINTSGMDVRDTDGTTSVASFGQTARIGRPSNARLMMNSNSIQAYDDSNNLYFEITGAGLGGQNLLRDTRTPIAFDVNAASSYMTHALYSTDGVNDNSGEDRSLAELGLVSGDKVTLSFDWSIEQNGSNAFTYGYFRIEMYGTKSDNTEGYIAAYYSTNAATFSASNLSGHYKKTVTLDANTVKTRRLVVRVDNSVLTLNISHMKLERGAMSSDWTEHPSDVTASIKTLVDTSNGLSSKVTKLENGLALSSTYFTQTDEGFVFNSEKIDEIDGNVEKISKYVRIEDDTLILGSKDPSIDQPVAAQLSSTGLTFHEASGGTLGAPIASFEIVDGRGKLVVHNAVVLQDLEFGDWAWAKRPNGNLALRWTGA